MGNLYTILGIDINTNFREIKKAFRAKLREVHPDISQDINADKNTKYVIFAYQTLSDPISRIAYDRIIGIKSRPNLWEQKESLEDVVNVKSEREWNWYPESYLDDIFKERPLNREKIVQTIYTANNYSQRVHIKFGGRRIRGLVAEVIVYQDILEMRDLSIALGSKVEVWGNMSTPDFSSPIGRHSAENITNILFWLKDNLEKGRYIMELTQNGYNGRSLPFYKIKKLNVNGVSVVSETGLRRL